MPEVKRKTGEVGGEKKYRKKRKTEGEKQDKGKKCASVKG